MSSANLTIVGNLTDDPELRFTATGKAVSNFTIAHTAQRFDTDTQSWVDAGETLFLNCTAWNTYAENIVESLGRGQHVIATGELVQKNWEDREGVNRKSYELAVKDIGRTLRFGEPKGGTNWSAPASALPEDKPAPSKRAPAKRTQAKRS